MHLRSLINATYAHLSFGLDEEAHKKLDRQLESQQLAPQRGDPSGSRGVPELLAAFSMEPAGPRG
jgi:hypothetical protein